MVTVVANCNCSRYTVCMATPYSLQPTTVQISLTQQQASDLITANLHYIDRHDDRHATLVRLKAHNVHEIQAGVELSAVLNKVGVELMCGDFHISLAYPPGDDGVIIRYEPM